MTRGTLNEGERLGGKYVVERLLAQGGMGEVYLAQHEVLGEPVAIKVLLAQYLNHDEALARFLNEAKAAAKIKSEHVARVSDVAVSERGMPYIVMEYLEGEDLERLIQTQGPMTPAAAVDAVLQALDAIAQAHALGMVHRDLKPSNLFRARLPDGSHIVKVLDFGISKVATTGSGKLTGTSSMLGSPMYTAPEQLRNARNATARSDVWSLGVILYELMSGRLPYEGETLGELIVTMMERDPTPLLEFAPSVPGGLSDIVMRCLRRVEDERYDGVRDLALALEPYCATDGRGAAVARRLCAASINYAALNVAVAQPLEPRAATMTDWSRSRNTDALPVTKLNRLWLWAGGAAAVAAMLGGAAMAFRSPAPAPSRAAAVAPTPPPQVVASEPPVAAPPPTTTVAVVAPADAGPHRPVPAVAVAARAVLPVASPSATLVHEVPVPQKAKAPRPSALPPGTSSRK